MPPLDFDPASVPREQIPALIAALAARLLEPAPAPAEISADDDADRLLTTREAAEMLGHSVKWMYRHAKSLPFARRIGSRDFRFELKGLRAWQARQRVR
jgi:predicted DNA-binding transcriptional regulator AlpA